MKRQSHQSTRRDFLSVTAISAVPLLAGSLTAAPVILVRKAKGPIAISSGNGRATVKLAVEEMATGMRPVDAAVHGVNLVENDPKDMSVGYGGLPNADGIVELDSCVMDGPTHLAGAVASIRNIKNPSQVALVVMRRTDHVLLVAEGALRFAKMHGFKEENILTEAARRAWLRWKERLSKRDDYMEARENQLREERKDGEEEGRREEERSPGTIHCSAMNSKGDFGSVTTTSGLSFKIPGRVGDSPLIGCGLYTDNDVGSAGSTGRGEAVILSNGSSAVVEQMRQGKSPKDACLEVLKRIAHYTRIPRLLNAQGRPNFGVKFYAINKKGEYGAAAFYPGGRYALHTDSGPSYPDAAYLYKSRR